MRHDSNLTLLSRMLRIVSCAQPKKESSAKMKGSFKHVHTVKDSTGNLVHLGRRSDLGARQAIGKLRRHCLSCCHAMLSCSF